MTANVRRFVILALCDTYTLELRQEHGATSYKTGQKGSSYFFTLALLQFSPFACGLGEIWSDTMLFSDGVTNTLKAIDL